ncbi:hypothetical protein KC887_01415 [Candidatus Kaiserbacteria bacterium]|nr:hypothetical protein [Candidatus Kaiserbacteria bacterium]
MICTHDPRIYKDLPIGMYHCPECGEMVIAGLEHQPPEDGMSDKATDWLRANAPDFAKAAFDAQDAENARLAVVVGDVQSFMLRGEMTPFEVIRDLGGLLKLRSLDLKYEADILVGDWLMQKRILETVKLAQEEYEGLEFHNEPLQLRAENARLDEALRHTANQLTDALERIEELEESLDERNDIIGTLLMGRDD